MLRALFCAGLVGLPVRGFSTVSVRTSTQPQGLSHRLRLSTASAVSTDVSDLGLLMDELDKPFDPEMALETAGTDTEIGYEWTETPTTLEIVMPLPALRGQQTAAMEVQLTATTFCSSGNFAS